MLPDPTRPFALLRRESRDVVEVLTGTVVTVASLAEIPDESLSLVPFRQVRERGFDCLDDGTPLSVLRIADRTERAVPDLLAALPATPVALRDGGFDVSDADYATIVEEVLRDEIGRGEGSNFVIHRVFEAGIDGVPVTAALAVYRRLLERERGAYWTFLVHTGERTLVGATPERHVSVEDGLVMMNPISGTFRHPGGVPDKDAVLRFLSDRKEIDELSMVLDEELKMMATVATEGGQVVGPYLKEMAHLVHTEYLLAGRSALDVRDVLRETMFAPTVVGSPIENACRVVARHERRGRGYYGAVLALIGRDSLGRQTLDAPILIRTADISAAGRLRVPVGATLVRHSTPAGEVAETHTKAAGVLAALGLGATPAGPARPAAPLAADPAVQAALVARNGTLAPFWLQDHHERALTIPELAGRRVLIIDAEDTFTGMLHHQLRVLGLDVTLQKYSAPVSATGYDLVVLGPGPGDPRRTEEPKMAAMRAVAARLLADGTPTLAVCLGHQLLSGLLGLPLRRKANPYQGMQRDIVFFGRPATVGFYSTFTATHPHDRFDTPYGPVELSRDPANGDVHALRGPTFAGVQFHPESVLSYDGIDLLRTMLTTLLPAAAVS
ncbi:chorismate-binding protein [Dactylosporangium aurantiacum]|uniref:anthranilate synthase n=1 Tax=Dactylosporangium aurantiacum TaxID=35754 RepID=A0A9Q9MPE1_9ACTN|nr:chorismate-binding protein [Dactylosporangium aurantiacum]MDG6108947.1 chorismate-binding protein [Dactylosporangium aurantiacum]UWZ56547.1 chorismate-binding protein [Dactylosporangium aurantiacum]